MEYRHLISVIVPVYNTERFLAETLDSLLAQTIANYEVILVDDGSTDGSAKIVRDYSARDYRFHPVYMKNNGVSAARNEGLRQAKGRYVVFLDSDDTLPPDALENMYRVITERRADCVFGGVREKDVFGTVYPKGAKYISEKEYISRYDRNIIYTLSVCNKMFDLNVIRKYGLEFRPLRFLEDGDFLMRFIEKSRRLSGCPEVVYNIRIRPFWEEPSATQSGTAEMFAQVTEAVDDIRATIIRMHDADLKRIERAGGSDEEIKMLDTRTIALIDTLDYRYISINIINTFYRIGWKNEWDNTPELRRMLEKTLPTISEEKRGFLRNNNPDIDFDKPLPDRRAIAADPMVSVVITDKAGKEHINDMLANLYSQRFPSFAVYIDNSLANEVDEVYRKRENLYFCSNTNLRGRRSVMKKIRSEYVIFADRETYWDYEAIRMMFAVMNGDRGCVLCRAKNKGKPGSLSGMMMRTEFVNNSPLLGTAPGFAIKAGRGRSKKSKAIVYTGSIEGLK